MPRAERPAKVLVVDDEPDMADSVRLMLERDGHQVLVETDGARALKLAEAERPDLVITDLCMPGLGGIELIETLRTLELHMPVIVITGYPSSDSAAWVRDGGAADYLTKPFHPDELCRRVNKVLGLGEALPG